MGLQYNTYLSSTKIYGCKTCKTHLANHDDIISRVSSSFVPPLNTPLCCPPSPSPSQIPGSAPS